MARSSYTNDDRRSMIDALLAAQRDWSAVNPQAHPSLKAADHMVTAAGNESDFGNPRFMANKFYNGVLQLNPTDPVKDTFAWPEVLQATSDSLNRIARFNPAVLKDTGGKPWTPDLIKQHYVHNVHVQAVGTLESGAADIRTMDIKLKDRNAAQQAGLVYMAHVIPQVAKIIGDNLDYKGPLKDLITPERINALPNLNNATPEKVKGWLAGNPSVFASGSLSPKATLDRWIATRYAPVVSQYASHITRSQNTPLPAGATGPVIAQAAPAAQPGIAPGLAIQAKQENAGIKTVPNEPGMGGLVQRAADWLGSINMPYAPDYIKAAYNSVSNWVAEKWNGKPTVAQAPEAQRPAPPAAAPAPPPVAQASRVQQGPAVASAANSDRFGTLNSMKKDAQLKRLIDSGEIRTYIAAMNGENKNVTPKAMKNFQERLKSAGVRDANQNPIVADGGIGPQMRELGKKLKTEAAALPPPPVAAKPKRTAAVRLD